MPCEWNFLTYLNSSWHQSGFRPPSSPLSPSATSNHHSPPLAVVCRCRTPTVGIPPELSQTAHFCFWVKNDFFQSCFFIFWNPNHYNCQAQLEKLFVVVCFSWVVVSWSRVAWPPREKRQCCSKRQETWTGEARLSTMCCSMAISRARCFGDSQIFQNMSPFLEEGPRDLRQRYSKPIWCDCESYSSQAI